MPSTPFSRGGVGIYNEGPFGILFQKGLGEQTSFGSCRIGIALYYGVDASIEENTFAGNLVGVEVFRGDHDNTEIIDNNFILTNVNARGILARFTKFYDYLEIYDNRITQYSDNSVGVEIVGVTYFYESLIWDNIINIYRGRGGIEAGLKIAGINIFENRINSYIGSNQGFSFGIRLYDSWDALYNSVKDNFINSENGFFSRGILFDDFRKTNIECNQLLGNNTNHAMEFHGTCTSSKIATNYFDGGLVGLRVATGFPNSGLIDGQSNQGNTWNLSANFAKGAEGTTNAATFYPFEVDVDDNPALMPPNPSPSNWFIDLEQSGETVSCNLVPIPLTEGVFSNVDRLIARRQLAEYYQNPVLLWNAERSLYAKIDKLGMENIEGEDFLQFYQSKAGSNLQKFYELEEAIGALASVDSEGLYSIINTLKSIETKIGYQAKELEMTRLYLKILKEGMSSITSTERDRLLEVAQECPGISGRAVYIAYGLLPHCDRGEITIDECSENQVEGLMQNINEGQLTKSNKLQVYPNPAKEAITIELPINELDGKMVFKLYNNLEQIVREIIIDSQEKSHQVNISDLTNGIYLSQLLIDGKIHSVSKVVIQD